MPTPSDGPDDGRAPEPEDAPLKTLSFFVLLALAVEIGLFALLGQAVS